MTTVEKARPDQTSADDLTTVREMLVGYQHTQVLYTACEIGLIDHLAAGVTDLQQLAQATGASADVLALLLDCLAGLGITTSDGNSRYALTGRGRLLDSRRHDGLHPTIMATGQHRYGPWADLPYTLRTGQSAFTRQHGQRLHDYYTTNPGAAAPFNQAMAALTQQNAAVLASAYPFGDHKLVVDVGGNLGVLMGAILTTYPGPRGIVFDLPHVAEQAARRLAEQGLSGRCETVSGDARHEVPAGADCYVMKMVLCDFPDQDAAAMLQAVRRAIGDGGWLVIFDRLRRPPRAGDPTRLRTAMSALNLMVMAGSVERSQPEYERLLTDAGFGVADVRRTAALDGELYRIRAYPQ